MWIIAYNLRHSRVFTLCGIAFRTIVLNQSTSQNQLRIYSAQSRSNYLVFVATARY
jgi:hypothetical protein